MGDPSSPLLKVTQVYFVKVPHPLPVALALILNWACELRRCTVEQLTFVGQTIDIR